MQTSITLTRPDDWHLHLRDGESLAAVINHTARTFGRAIVMPNLKPPVTTVEQAKEYRQRILTALEPGLSFTPLMTLYLTESMPADEITRASESGFVHAVKFYPAGATTHSEAGARDLVHCEAVIARMAEVGMPLLVHGEVTDPEVDIFDREAVFIDRHLMPLLKRHPNLKVVMEHITTEQAVQFVNSQPGNVAATITAHHLLYNRNALFQGGIRPHFYCLPVLKREQHRQALVAAATSGSPKFFLGTDSAPHAKSLKEAACGCAGIYTAHAALELYAEAFDKANALDKLEGFASHFGPDFYGLPRNQDSITLARKPWVVPLNYSYGDSELVPLRAGEVVEWKAGV
jgi:dihydroorotase